jgi:hypothetical protein
MRDNAFATALIQHSSINPVTTNKEDTQTLKNNSSLKSQRIMEIEEN